MGNIAKILSINEGIKIATHDSATGEKGKGLLSILGIPFARTQSKTIREQYEAGCRMFDIRVKLFGRKWRCAHGLWKSERLALDIIKEINSFSDKCYVTLTYEGNSKKKDECVEFVDQVKAECVNIHWGGIAIKYGEDAHLFKVKYDYLYQPKKWPSNKQGFLPLNGSTWHILLPIPWLWKKIYNDKPEFNEECFIYVDFL